MLKRICAFLTVILILVGMTCSAFATDTWRKGTIDWLFKKYTWSEYYHSDSKHWAYAQNSEGYDRQTAQAGAWANAKAYGQNNGQVSKGIGS